MPNFDQAKQTLLIALLALALIGGGALFYRMVERMGEMTALMGEMSTNLTTVTQEMSAMRASMERMEGHVGQMGQGMQRMERVNPLQMMPGVR